MSTIENTASNFDLKSKIQAENSLKSSNNKTTYILIGILSAIAIITTIILLAVFIPKKNKSSRIFSLPSTKSDLDDYSQTIELLIDGKEKGKIRNLQEEEKIQILGKNFEELNSINSQIYLDGEKVAFNKYLSIKSSSLVKVNIKFFEKYQLLRICFQVVIK